MKKVIVETENGWFGFFEDIPAVCAQAPSESECNQVLDVSVKVYLNYLANL